MMRALKGIRGRILAIAVLAFVPPTLLCVYLTVENWQAAEDDARTFLAMEAIDVASRHASAVREIRSIVSVVAEQPRLRRAAEVGGEECRTILREISNAANHGSSADFTNFALSDVKTGLPLCSVLTGRSASGVGLVGWFREIVDTGDFVFGGYRVGVVTGRAILIGGTLVRDAAGAPLAVLLGTVGLATVTGDEATWDKTPGLTATIFAPDGTILFRYPDARMAGQKHPDAPLIRTATAAGGSETFFDGAGLDGVMRINAIRRLEAPEPAFVTLGQPARSVHAPGRRLAVIQFGLLGATLLSALLAVWMVSDRLILSGLRALGLGTQRVLSGDYAARVQIPGRGELPALARSFNDMAATLERRREEIDSQRQELGQVAAELRAIFGAMQDGIIVRNAQGVIVDANPAAETILGRSREQILGVGFERVLPWQPVDASGAPLDVRANAVFLAARGGMGTRDVVMGVHRPDGTRRWISVNTGVTRNDAGDIDFVVASFSDITERKRIEDQLRQSQKMEVVGQLTGGIAHDFNNLLLVIITNLEMLMEGDETGTERHEMAETALRTALRGADLVRKLMSFSRRQSLNPARIDVNASIGELVPLLRRTLGTTVRIEASLSETAGHAIVDPGEFENALLNLAVNARDAMPRGVGTIVIRTSLVRFAPPATDAPAPPGTYVEVAVEDDGAGMSSEVAARVFEPFFTTKEPGKGSGLGLAMVYGFVQQSGGGITIESEIGKGTTVRFYLPVAAPSAAAEKPAAS